ncbi:hypothetical protein ABEV04_15400, partial [Heyndrickxia faecalis]
TCEMWVQIYLGDLLALPLLGYRLYSFWTSSLQQQGLQKNQTVLSIGLLKQKITKHGDLRIYEKYNYHI